MHEAITGGRLSLYRHAGKGWRELSRKTEVGGSDWFVPILIGPLDRSLFGAMMFGGGLVGFMTSQVIDAPAIDLDAWLKRWKLSGREGLRIGEGELSDVARRVLADSALPAASAAMQYLASYVWLGGWGGKDRAVQAGIIRDPRVTDFPYVRQDYVTPSELAQPLVDRIASTQLAGEGDERQFWANRETVKRLAMAFSLLSPCAAAPMRGAREHRPRR